MNPPRAEKRPTPLSLHGDTRLDDYFWLREKENPEVLRHLEAENAYADAVMKPTEPLQEMLYKEILGHIKETDLSVPVRKGAYLYYSRTEEGKQYPVFCRKRDVADAGEEITLDLNALAVGREFLGLGAYEVSDDGNLLAYSTDTTGYRQFTLYVKDLRTGELLPERIERVGSVMWATDGRTLYFTTEDAVTKRSDRFHRHTVGEDSSELLYTEDDEKFDLWAHRTKDRRFVLLNIGSKTSTEVRYLPADGPASELRVISPRELDHEYDADHHGDRFFIRTNKGAKNFRLVTAPEGDPRQGNWEEFLPYRPEVKVVGVQLFAGHAVVTEQEAGQRQIRVVDLRDRSSHRIGFSESLFAAYDDPDANPEFCTTTLRLKYQSMVTPETVYDYDMDARRLDLLKRTDVPGYDPARYTTERVFATAADGTRVPISLVYRNGTERSGENPMLLIGYGSYGISIPPAFSARRIPLLDRGMILGYAHVRGGGEMGEEWREAGRMKQKVNTFTDFIACAEHLIDEGYTSPDRLAAQGGSAGGLLMGAVANMRPDLFRAVIADVPFVDVLTTMLDASLPLTTAEYLEWGDPNEKEYYDVMKSYSPVDNVRAQPYPAMLVNVSLNDSQVPYWEGAKLVAKLRDVKTDGHVLLLKTNMGAGHGGASGRYDALRETAFDYAFLLTQLGVGR